MLSRLLEESQGIMNLSIDVACIMSNDSNVRRMRARGVPILQKSVCIWAPVWGPK